MAPSVLKKALSFRAVELALQGQCERDGEVVWLASEERVQQRLHPERSSERFGEQHDIFEVTKISSKDQILQRTGDQILKGFPQDRVQQRLVVPETMVEQLEEVPKMVSQSGIQRRAAEHIVDRPALVLPERIFWEDPWTQRGYRSNQDLMPRPEFAAYSGQTCVDSVEVDKIVLFSERMSEQSEVVEVTEISSQNRICSVRHEPASRISETTCEQRGRACIYFLSLESLVCLNIFPSSE